MSRFQRFSEAKSSIPLFEARDVCADMPQDNGMLTVFHDLDFTLQAGEIVDITGPSGSGKSTLLTAFARLNTNTTGTFLLEGRDSESMTPQEWRQHVAYVPQTSTLVGSNVADAIRFPWRLKIRREHTNASSEDLLPDSRIRELLDCMGCEDIPLNRDPLRLSGGQSARVSLARTILTRPKVLLADEVDAGLDDENADKVADILKQAAQNGAAVVRIRHRGPDGRATRIMRLEHGVISLVSADEGA